MNFGLKASKPARKPRLTPLMKKKGLSFAKANRSWTSEDWAKVLFSDKSSVQQFSIRVQHVWRPSVERYHEKYRSNCRTPSPPQVKWFGGQCQLLERRTLLFNSWNNYERRKICQSFARKSYNCI